MCLAININLDSSTSHETCRKLQQEIASPQCQNKLIIAFSWNSSTKLSIKIIIISIIVPLIKSTSLLMEEPTTQQTPMLSSMPHQEKSLTWTLVSGYRSFTKINMLEKPSTPSRYLHGTTYCISMEETPPTPNPSI